MGKQIKTLRQPIDKYNSGEIRILDVKHFFKIFKQKLGNIFMMLEKKRCLRQDTC